MWSVSCDCSHQDIDEIDLSTKVEQSFIHAAGSKKFPGMFVLPGTNTNNEFMMKVIYRHTQAAANAHVANAWGLTLEGLAALLDGGDSVRCRIVTLEDDQG